MPRRMLHFRFTFALLGCAALLGGAMLELNWLAGPGCVAAAISDVIGMAQARARFPLPADRALRGAAEAFPALGVTAYEPAAIGITIAVVIYALMANGIQTVSISRGLSVPLAGPETWRRVATSLASMLVLAVPVALTTGLPHLGYVRHSPLTVTGVGLCVSGLGAVFALTVMWWSVVRMRIAPNVDT